MSYAEDTRYFNERQSIKRKCKHCGHTQAMHHLLEKVVCRWCHNYIFKDEITEFKYRLKEKQLKEMRNGND